MEKAVNYSDFEKRAAENGLKCRRCNEDHWQLLNGSNRSPVNVWAHSKRGFRYQFGSDKSRIGTLDDAILFAGPFTQQPDDSPPWEEQRQPEHVGLIRRLWRFIW